MAKKTRFYRTLTILLLALGGLTLSAGVTKHAFETVNQPFAGVLPFQNLYVGAFTQPHWEGGKLQLQFHDRLTGTEGKPPQSIESWHQHLQEVTPGKKMEISTSSQRARSPFFLSVSLLPANDVFRIFLPLVSTGIAFLVIGLLVALITPPPIGVLPFLIYCGLTAVYFLTAYDFHTTYQFSRLLLLAFSLIPASVIHLALSFPRPWSRKGLRKKVIGVSYCCSLGLAIPYILLFMQAPIAWKWVEYALFLYLSGAYLVWVAIMIFRAKHDTDEDIKKQCRLILLPLLPAFGSMFVVGWLIFFFDLAIPLNYWAPICAFFPATIAYGMLRHNLFLVENLRSEVEQRTAALKRTQAELSEASRLAAVGQLAAGTAHEIGNAMNLIRSNIPVLKKYASRLFSAETSAANSPTEAEDLDFSFMKEDFPDLLENLERGSERAIEITGALKSFSKPDSEARVLVHLAQVMDRVLQVLRPELNGRIEVTTSYEKKATVMAGAGQMHQLFLNLLLNASGAIEGEGSIKIHLRREGGNVITSITDSGKGISPEQMERIFEPFFTTKDGGTGLGLSVSYGIATAHGGTLEFSSQPGQGTTAVLTLPAVNS